MIPEQSDLSPAAIVILSGEVLPGWYDDWVLVEAEDWRQLRLHALETLADRLAAAGCWGQAADAARAIWETPELVEFGSQVIGISTDRRAQGRLELACPGLNVLRIGTLQG